MTDYLIQDTSLSALADAVRNTTGTNETMTVSEMVDALSATSTMENALTVTGRDIDDITFATLYTLDPGTYLVAPNATGSLVSAHYGNLLVAKAGGNRVWAIIAYDNGSVYALAGYTDGSKTSQWRQIDNGDILLKAYPVGAVYISYSSTSPASLFGGTWTAITGKFPYFNAGTGTGGSNTHTLSVSEMPSHNHGLRLWCNSGTGGNAEYGITYADPYDTYGGSAREWAASASYNRTLYTGSGSSHNNMPAYQTLYAWRRTA